MLKIAEIKSASAAIADELLKVRHHLHAHPELSFEEEKTATYISEWLTKMGLEHQTGIAGYGITGLIKGRNPEKKVVALRADIDALPIFEKNNVLYKSQNPGVMHACGHDVHTTCLLGALQILNERKSGFEGTVKFIFQPAEEKLPGGALKMIDAGILENPPVDTILGQHVYPALEVGKVGFKSGNYMASADEISLVIRGRGGHAAMPDVIDDTVLSMAEIIVSLQGIVSRNAPPSVPTVLSFGEVKAAGAVNIIPSEVVVRGTFRTFNENWRAKAHRLITENAQMIANIHGCSCQVMIDKGYPGLNNHPEVTALARHAAEQYLGKENVVDLDIRMTAEDFARFARRVPACFYRLGTRNEEKGITSGLHTSQFDVDEKSLEIGTGLLAWETLQQLKV